MTTDRQLEELATTAEFDEFVRELDAILDAWFMSEVTPALDEACRAGLESNAQAA